MELRTMTVSSDHSRMRTVERMYPRTATTALLRLSARSTSFMRIFTTMMPMMRVSAPRRMVDRVRACQETPPVT